MKRTTLRTSAIALGVAAALPATAQEWNLGWGGFMQQRIAVASSEQKFTRSGALSGTITITPDTPGSTASDRGDNGLGTAHVRFSTDTDLPDADTAKGIHTVAAIGSATLADLFPAVDDDQDKTTTLHVGGVQDDNIAAFILALNNHIFANGQKDINGLEIVFYTTSSELTQLTDAVNDALEDKPTIKLSGGGQHAASEIHFKPSVTLENGLTFAAQIELEGDNAGFLDESYMTISSDSLGMFTIGGENSEGYRLMVAAPSVGLGINSGAHQNFLPGYGRGHYRQAAGSRNTEVDASDDVPRISYRTPSLGGLTLGVSYAPNNGANQLISESKGDVSDIMDIGAQFKQSLGEAGVTLSARYGTGKMHEVNKKPREAAVGAQVSFGAFTLGGAYADSQRYDKDGNDHSSSGWSLGMSYAMEAWTFGIETYQGEHDNGDKQSVSKIAASRNLGPGVNWDLYAITAEGEDSASETVKLTTAAGATIAGAAANVDKKTSGTIFGTAIRLNF